MGWLCPNFIRSIIFTIICYWSCSVSHILDKRENKSKKRDETKVCRIDTIHNYAIKRYELLYYCLRDDVVFIPGEDIAVPPKDLKALCYSEVRKDSEHKNSFI